jgi:hypothetical protein
MGELQSRGAERERERKEKRKSKFISRTMPHFLPGSLLW